MTRLSVVAPVYNEEENIYDFYVSITNALKGKIESYEIVLVNDGSRDRSATYLNEIAQMDRAVNVIHFDRTYGQTAAIWAGMKNSKGELIALMDADLQTDPRNIFNLMPFIERIDFVNGKRANRRDRNRFLNRITRDSNYDTRSPMKLLTREVADSFYLYNGMHRFLPALAKMNGFSVIEVSVTQNERKNRVSKYGDLNHLDTGIMDAFMIGWLKKRVIHYRIER
ncbi:glycosyltransferase family 2 protein [Paenibacillus sp. HN-1]|uniref:glycosyltransferase family 2 protein n=1 Tax=Paenibacillus TaxID=44249 RepID=UPI001CA9CD91|nr:MULTISPECIES: glycosyltransferase family 2 protein [Paenibacillus]MBY9079340.1 glycosyltransferase family 2 protein [Paenibacillus sp. CGMCC 1.18879]MBY9087725.1 glycosyltransferase family 2 protein [Paenibacillus sinensis]